MKSYVLVILLVLIVLIGRCAVPVAATEKEYSSINFTLEDVEDDALDDDDFDEIVDSNGSDDDDSDEEQYGDHEEETSDAEDDRDDDDYDDDDYDDDDDTDDDDDDDDDKQDHVIESLPETVAFGTLATITQGSVESYPSLLATKIFSFFSSIWNHFRASFSILFGAVGERVRRKNVLSNKKRKKMYNFILTHPGSHFRDVLRATKASPNEGGWHLGILEKTGWIKSAYFGRYLLYYPNGYQAKDQEGSWNARFILRQDRALKIAKSLEKNPGYQVKELAELLSMHPNTIRYHMNHFEELGLIERTSHGKTTRLFLKPGIDDLIMEVESEPLPS